MSDRRKKRKGGQNYAPAEVTSEPIDGDEPTAILPPDNSKLSDIQRILMVELNEEDEDAVLLGLSNLTSLCSSCGDADAVQNRKTVSKAGGQGLIVRAMRKWYTSPKILAAASQALQNAAFENDTFLADARECTSLETIVWAMKNYPNDIDVQDDGCGALTNLIVNHEENAVYAIEELGGGKVILAAMKQFPNELPVQKWAAWALLNASSFAELKNPLVAAGSLELLGVAIRLHEHDENVPDTKFLQEKARLAMKRLL